MDQLKSRTRTPIHRGREHKTRGKLKVIVARAVVIYSSSYLHSNFRADVLAVLWKLRSERACDNVPGARVCVTDDGSEATIARIAEKDQTTIIHLQLHDTKSGKQDTWIVVWRQEETV